MQLTSWLGGSCLLLAVFLSACAGEREGNDPNECSDGADNDSDGLFDCKDDDCFGAPACAELRADPQGSDAASQASEADAVEQRPTSALGGGGASPIPGGVGHCAAGETAFFSCAVADGKTLSVCGSTPSPQGWLQYRFGRIGDVELAYPEDRAYRHFAYERLRHSRSESDNLMFRNGSFQFSVTHQDGGVEQSFAGVLVERDRKTVARKECTDISVSDLALLAPVVPAPAQEAVEAQSGAEWEPLSKAFFGGGPMTITSATISWNSGTTRQYKVVSDGGGRCLVRIVDPDTARIWGAPFIRFGMSCADVVAGKTGQLETAFFDSQPKVEVDEYSAWGFYFRE